MIRLWREWRQVRWDDKVRSWRLSGPWVGFHGR